jgi:acetate kinase
VKTLVVNSGSSSLKCSLFGNEHELIAKASVDAIGTADARLNATLGTRVSSRVLAGADHAAAFDAVCDDIAGAADIDCVGHRVVHGGEKFCEATLIDDDTERAIEDLVPLAPLHNPLCLIGIRAARKRFPKARHVAVFDTAFHQTLPDDAFTYALPYHYYTEFGVRRYGFHGSSHRSVSARAIERLGRVASSSRIITCHLGAGCSTAAVRDGRSIDTSMGMTPLEGLVMATRSGDIDPGIVGLLARTQGMSAQAVEDVMLNESGLLGLSGISGDMRELLEKAGAGSKRAELALSVFAHRVRKYIGAHLVTLGGADAIVLTGGAGENSPALRSRILEGLEGLGIELDATANADCVGSEGTITTATSRVAVYVIASNEELAIAKEARALVDPS